jgi:acetyl esterase/lipase
MTKSVKASSGQVVSLWPDLAPVGDGTFQKAEVRLTVYLPSCGGAARAAFVICPGGGYHKLVMDTEGHGIATWLGRHGIAGMVLEYRMPGGRSFVPLLDAQRAIRTVRANAKEWNVDPGQVGIIGFSAGGHVAATAGTCYDAGDPKAADPIDRLGCRPDFVVLVYPVVTMGDKAHGGSRDHLLGRDPRPEMLDLFSAEKQVTDKTPPMFITHAMDDSLVVPDNSLMLYEALKAHNVRAEYLELASGGHGLNGKSGPMWDAWQARSLEWLAELGML